MSQRSIHAAATVLCIALTGCASGGIDVRSRGPVLVADDAGVLPGDAAWAVFGDAGPAPLADSGLPVIGEMPPGTEPVLPGTPALRCGRTYDHETSFVLRGGAPTFVTLRHRDGTSLPADEGGASCGTSCTEEVTRLCDGDSLTGVLENAASFSVQGAQTDEEGTGSLVVTIGPDELAPMSYAVTSTSIPGFVNGPQPAAPVASRERTAVVVRATGGCVYVRAVTVTCAEPRPNEP